MGKWILVTGASSGIGLSIVKYLDENGYKVILCSRNNDKLNKVKRYLHSDSVVIPADLSKTEDITGIFAQLKELSIKLDGLVHCAGMGRELPIKNNDYEYMNKIMATNYYSFVELGKYFSKKIHSNNESSIVAISSISPLTCYTGVCNYAASKGAINVAVKVMAKEFMRRKIRVNAILPAYVNTPMGPAEDDEEYIKQQPLGIIKSEYIAYLVEYLLSEKAKYVTGTLIPVSGGMSY